ncbi:diguanylate cyclase [Thiovibrio sp. JS02]
MTEEQAKNKPCQQGLFRFFNCESKNFLGCFIRKCLDTSVTGKLVGMLIVSLLGFTLVMAQHLYTLHNIEKLTRSIETENIPHYKVSQYILRSLNGFKISLLHLLHQDKVGPDDKNILANLQRLELLERMLVSLKQGGTLLDVAKASQKTMDIITVAPSRSREADAIIDGISAEFKSLEENFRTLAEALTRNSPPALIEESTAEVVDNLDELHGQVTALAILVNDSYNQNLAETTRTIHASKYKSFLTSAAIAVVLAIGTMLYIFLIVVPLKDILKRITFITEGEGDLTRRIEVRTQDEVGQLARQLNTLVDNIFSLNTFKAVIEEEESTTEVNRRLAALLEERYGFTRLFVYEMPGNKNTMTVAYASGYEDICSPDILDDCNACRAKRTGHPISSIQYPEICKKFPHGDRLEHHCIPMIANGRAVGIVQFLYAKAAPREELERFEQKVKRASRYIAEATPVLEAKRFASALQETTLKDPMTGLYNRRFLETYTETLVAGTKRRGSKLGILMCDMDFFKEVNDNYGHETGDTVLIRTAEVLQQCVRASDIVIRYGGEEFLVLLADVQCGNDIAELAERIRLTMENTVIKIPEGSLQKTVSIGYSLFPDDTDGLWESIKYADVALYRAKESGRNKVVGFKPEMWEEEKY